MSKKTKYTHEPIKAEVIPDFLPPPEHLVIKDGVKVAISLKRGRSKSSRAKQGR